MFRNNWGKKSTNPETKNRSALTTMQRVVGNKKWLKAAGKYVCVPLMTFATGFGVSHQMHQPTLVELRNNVTTLTATNMSLEKLNYEQQTSIQEDYVLIDTYVELQEKYTALQNDYSDLSSTLDTVRSDKKKTEEKYQKLVHTIQTSDNGTVKFNDSDVRVLSGATADQFNKILKGTWLEGYGEVFERCEKQYKVNALFSIGNAIIEAGWDGDSYLARTRNNIYGLATSRVFDSKTECIEYWFDLISDHYVGDGLYSISRINEKYCPPNARWSSDITWIVKKLLSKSNITVN